MADLPRPPSRPSAPSYATIRSPHGKLFVNGYAQPLRVDMFEEWTTPVGLWLVEHGWLPVGTWEMDEDGDHTVQVATTVF